MHQAFGPPDFGSCLNSGQQEIHGVTLIVSRNIERVPARSCLSGVRYLVLFRRREMKAFRRNMFESSVTELLHDRVLLHTFYVFFAWGLTMTYPVLSLVSFLGLRSQFGEWEVLLVLLLLQRADPKPDQVVQPVGEALCICVLLILLPIRDL